ncbi:MAG: metallophosphoesterase [Nitrosomonadaceae bacterium]
MKSNLRLIGDVHGNYEKYHQLLRKAESTVQLGDFGFDYQTLSNVDARQHRIVGGNHDNYDDMGNWPHFLGDYGVHSVDGFGDIFFIRGGVSIDRCMRTEGVDWWANEELNMSSCYSVVDEYTRIKPTFVVSHECPITIVPYVTASLHIIPSRTNQLLERLFGIHQPDQWVFGHYHKSWSEFMDGTRFTCLNKLECLDF